MLSKRTGFSLIEVMVVMAIFLTMMLIVSDIFIGVTSKQKKTLTSQQAVTESSLKIEQIVQTVRTNMIDYSYYRGNINGPVDTLALVDDEGERFLFSQSENCGDLSSRCLTLIRDGQENIISPPRLNMDRIEFVIIPSSDPYVAGSGVDQQPIVTMLLEGSPVNGETEDVKPLVFQTSVTSRHYER
jgi:prepilin-type N-terminal cleavage/methylation domain-containing protein